MTSRPILFTMPILPTFCDDRDDAVGEDGERSALTPRERRQLDSRPCQSRRMSEVVDMRALRTPVMGERRVWRVDGNVDAGGALGADGRAAVDGSEEGDGSTGRRE